MSEFLRTVQVTRYISPLREGGSLPALVDADDDFKYVLKFRGAGHGVKALISEFLGGEIARMLGFKVPELVFAYLDEDFGRSEGDEEIQDLLRGSHGLNLGLHFLSGALTFDPAVTRVDEETASRIVWLDAFITNIDRTFRNTNMLIWKKELWLIDHGAAFYFHHTWENWQTTAKTPFAYIKDHVLLPQAAQLDEANTYCLSKISEQQLHQLVDALPDSWLEWRDLDASIEEIRHVYKQFLSIRLQHTSEFINEAKKARHALI